MIYSDPAYTHRLIDLKGRELTWIPYDRNPSKLIAHYWSESREEWIRTGFARFVRSPSFQKAREEAKK